MVNVNDIILTSLETITAFDVVTGGYLFTLDELQNATLGQTQEDSEATGKGGRKISKLKRNKAVTISGSNGLVSGGLLEMQTGGNFTEGTTKVMWYESLIVGDNHEANTTYIAVGTTGAEIDELFIRNADGTIGTSLTQNSEVSAGKFTYNPATKVLKFNNDIAKGTEIVVYYQRNIVASSLINRSDKFSKKAALYIDAFGEDKCSNVYRVQIYIPKADFSGEFSLEIGNDQTVHEFEAEALAGACGAGGNLWTYNIFGANAADSGEIPSA